MSAHLLVTNLMRVFIRIYAVNNVCWLCELSGNEQSGIDSSGDGEPDGAADYVKPGDHAPDDAE